MIEIYSIIDFLAFTGGVTGAILIGRLNKKAFLFYIVGSSATAALAIHNNNPWLLITCIIFILIDIYYYVKWTNKDPRGNRDGSTI